MGSAICGSRRFLVVRVADPAGAVHPWIGREPRGARGLGPATTPGCPGWGAAGVREPAVSHTQTAGCPATCVPTAMPPASSAGICSDEPKSYHVEISGNFSHAANRRPTAGSVSRHHHPGPGLTGCECGAPGCPPATSRLPGRRRHAGCVEVAFDYRWRQAKLARFGALPMRPPEPHAYPFLRPHR